MNDIQERWKAAQEQEQKLNEPTSWVEGFEHFRKVAIHYFDILDINHPAGNGISILEVGPANFPICVYHNTEGVCTIFEPIETSWLKTSLEQSDKLVINHRTIPFEKATVEEIGGVYSEAWLFNVLQHVQDPVKVINKCKKHAKVIRFFEPINQPTDTCHLHTFDIEFFRKYFGDCVKHYKFSENEHRNEFHRADCAYGTYIVEK